MYQILKTAQEWLKTSESVCLAIVSKTWGSAPRRAGSSMVIHPDGHFEGSVSGGCVEGTVITEALALSDSHHKSLSFTVSNDDAWQVGLACGGDIEIQLFKLTTQYSELLEKAVSAITERRFMELLFSKESCEYSATPCRPANTIIEDSESHTKLYISPRNRMLIIGAVHIAQYLSPIAVDCDYEVIIIDPRTSFTENRAFKGATVVQDWPDEYIKANPIDQSTAVITLTHDPKIDDAILKPALISKAFYIGSLGSKKTHVSRLERLKIAGYSAQALARIHGPVGLNIGAANPAEIAVSIMAEVTDILRTNRAV